jgi:hypothetical protein
MTESEDLTFKYGDRIFCSKDVHLIQHTFRLFPKLSQTELIETVCEHLEWLTSSGLPKRRACKELLLQMEEQGLVQLPPARCKGAAKRPPPSKTSQTNAPEILAVSLKAISPVSVEPVTDDKERHLWNEYVERYHPLGYKHPFGYAIRYFIRANEQYLGCIMLSGASRALAPRDRWIGWKPKQRKANLSWIVNNSRYLIFPWVKVPYLASHVLGQLARRVARDWDERWGFSPLLLETFVDPAHYSGVCYQASGWELLGETTGRGLAQPGKIYSSSPKLIYIKPLSKQCQSLLCSTLQGRTEL